MMAAKQNLSEHLLFEIGTEEIPSDYLDGACESIRLKVPNLLEECGYQCDRLEIYSTPRRFVIFGRNCLKKPATIEKRLGPLREQCYQNNVPTQVLLGFLKNANKTESDVVWVETNKGSRASVPIQKQTKPLRYFFETLPFQIEFPKLMRWDSNFKFVRPIRWTFALVGTKFQNFQIGLLKSGCVTYGHRFLANRKISVKKADIDSYKTMLQKNHVILDPEERVRMIRGFLKNAHQSDENLIRRVANLVEEPFPIIGTFDKKYLALPAEVLSTCMRKHQRIFACYDGEKKLTNRFIAVINGRRVDIKTIARNYEDVLISRLEDAKFFYQEDIKTTLETKYLKLKELIFLGKLGSYFERANGRFRKLVKHIAVEMKDWPADSCKLLYDFRSIQQDSDRTAILCKADLVSHLVYEFPELQGVAGSEYARRDGENEWVSRAIKEHYYPFNLSQNYKDLARMSPPAVLVSLADRIDLLVGAIGIGIEPSGSKDPYALRRAAGGIIKLIRAFPISFSIEKLVHAAVDFYGHLLKADSSAVLRKIKELFKDRMIFELDLKPGTKPYEIFQAVFAVTSDDLAGVYERFGVLMDLYQTKTEEFKQACKIVERTSNILKGVKEIPSDVNRQLFEKPEEQALYQILCEKESSIRKLLTEKKYGLASAEYSKAFYKSLHDFFDQVMVNVDDQKIRANRQALMKKINGLYTEKLADLSLITNQ